MEQNAEILLIQTDDAQDSLADTIDKQADLVQSHSDLVKNDMKIFQNHIWKILDNANKMDELIQEFMKQVSEYFSIAIIRAAIDVYIMVLQVMLNTEPTRLDSLRGAKYLVFVSQNVKIYLSQFVLFLR